MTIVKLGPPDGACNLELIEGRWQPHFAVTVPEIDPWMGMVQFSKAPAYYIQDPWGNWVELVEVKV